MAPFIPALLKIRAKLVHFRWRPMRRFSLWKLSLRSQRRMVFRSSPSALLIALCEWRDLNNETTCSYRSRRRCRHSCDGVGPSTVTTIVRRALARAGLDPAFKGAHVLRHSLATSMLRSHASMREIGEVLRHRVSSTTEIYAKLDFDALRPLAHPWPRNGGEQ